MFHGRDLTKAPNPKRRANFLSQTTFFFTFNLFRKGFKGDIQETDIYEVLPKLKASTVGDQLEEKWRKETTTKTNPSIYRLLWSCYGKYYFLLGVLQLVVKITSILVLPRAQGKLVSYFSRNSEVSKSDAIFYGSTVISFNIFLCMFAHNYRFLVTELGIKMKTAFCSLIYRKALKMSPTSLSQNGVGKIVTLISKDVVSFENIIIFLNDIWISAIIFVVAGTLMYLKIGVASLFGLLLLLLVVPLQVYLGKLTATLRVKAAAATDARLQLSQEALSTIKLVKMQTLERHVTEKIIIARKLEVRRLRMIYFAKAAFIEIGAFVIKFILYILVLGYTQLGNILTAETVSFLYECLRALHSPITISIPLGILRSAELAASVERISALLTAEEETKRVVDSSPPVVELEGAMISIHGLVIDNINIEFNGLSFITGRVGSGKTSLLKAILTSSVSRGGIKVSGSVSYAAEEPWLFPSSIKQNVVFGQELDEARYQEVMRVCALDADCRAFNHGDDTIVDDGGRNLSRGQQVRINLARAVYSNSDVYLLDDFLPALDVHVQEFVFTECIKKFLKDKIVVMVAKNRRFLGRGDNVFVIDSGSVKRADPLEFSEDATSFSEEVVDDVNSGGVDSSKETTLGCASYLNIYHEEPQKGKVNMGVYAKYVRFGGGFLVLVWILGMYAVTQIGLGYSDDAIRRWINTQEKLSELNPTNTTDYAKFLQKDKSALNFYTLAIIFSIIFLIMRTYIHFNFAAKAALRLHNSLVTTVINAVMDFFDVRYFGNILNRFAKDICAVDEDIPFKIHECLKFLCSVVSIFILILTVKISFIILVVVIVIVLFLVRWIYIPTGRSLQRLDSATRSPVIGHLNATLEGLSTIRAFGTQDILKKEFDRHQDLYFSTQYMLQSASRAFAYVLDMLSNFFIAAIIITFLASDKDTQAASVGLAISQALRLPGLLQWGIREWAALESNMTAVERVLEFSTAKTEDKIGEESERLCGDITYKNVGLSYRKSKGEVLSNVNFTIKSGEKIGVVGRTGAGKSSLISLLFRFYDYEGTITINGVDIQTLSLNFLRSNITVISQDLTLFKGTIRGNIDPTGGRTDEELWNVINKVNLKSLIPELDTEVSEGGSNFSLGQKQLICLVRALVNNNRILVLDEATANVDAETENIIQEMIREQFSKCTIITVAHKLESVMELDKVMVVDHGGVVEFDQPEVLMGLQDGVFRKMVVKARLQKED